MHRVVVIASRTRKVLDLLSFIEQQEVVLQVLEDFSPNQAAYRPIKTRDACAPGSLFQTHRG